MRINISVNRRKVKDISGYFLHIFGHFQLYRVSIWYGVGEVELEEPELRL